MSDINDELDDLLDERRMAEKDVAICLDLTLIAARDEAMEALARAAQEHAATQKPNPDAPMAGGGQAKAKKALDDATARVKAVEKQIAERSITLRITGVDRVTYNQWLLACPPRPKRNETFDPTKFFMFAARRSAKFVSKKDGSLKDITDPQWARIDKTLTDGEHDRIAEAVIEVNRSAGSADVGFFVRGSATTPAS
jgi:hypothetical protein